MTAYVGTYLTVQNSIATGESWYAGVGSSDLGNNTGWIFSSPPGSYVCDDYLNIKNSSATGGATWYAGSHSVDSGNNTGWVFFGCPGGGSSLGGGSGSAGIRLYGPGTQTVLAHSHKRRVLRQSHRRTL